MVTRLLNGLNILSVSNTGVKIDSLLKSSLFCAGLLVSSSLSAAQECLWVEQDEAEKYLPTLVKGMSDVLEWPSEKCEEARQVSMQEYTRCFCDLRALELADFKRDLELVTKVAHPEWRGKKVCYKSDEFTSENVFIPSFESILKRCGLD